MRRIGTSFSPALELAEPLVDQSFALGGSESANPVYNEPDVTDQQQQQQQQRIERTGDANVLSEFPTVQHCSDADSRCYREYG